MQQHSIRIDKELCTGCTACARDCPESNIIMQTTWRYSKTPAAYNAAIVLRYAPKLPSP